MEDYEIGKRCFNRGEYAEAVERLNRFRKPAEKLPETPERSEKIVYSLYYITRACFELKRYGEVLHYSGGCSGQADKIRDETERKRIYVACECMQAQVRYYRGEFEDSLVFSSFGLRKDENNTEIRLWRAKTHFKLNDHAEVFADCRIILGMGEEPQEAFEMLDSIARAYFQKGNRDLALQVIDCYLAVRISVPLLLLRAKINGLAEKYEEVVTDCETILKTRVDDEAFKLLEAIAVGFRTGNSELSFRATQAYISKKQDNIKIWLVRARINVERHCNDLAIQDCLAVLRCEERHPEACAIMERANKARSAVREAPPYVGGYGETSPSVPSYECVFPPQLSAPPPPDNWTPAMFPPASSPAVPPALSKIPRHSEAHNPPSPRKSGGDCSVM